MPYYPPAAANLTAPGPIGSVTPNTGAFTTLGATSLALGGATIGSDAFAVTGTAKISASLAIAGATIGSNALAVTGTAAISGAITAGGLILASGNNVAWNADSNLSRVSAGVVGVGTGAAASVAGSVQALQYTAAPGTGIPAGGSNTFGFKATSATNFGLFFGSGAPSLAAAQGSLYLRSDGSTVATRGYINTDGNTTWTPITTVG